jgi:hypothetical protein
VEGLEALEVIGVYMSEEASQRRLAITALPEVVDFTMLFSANVSLGCWIVILTLDVRKLCNQLSARVCLRTPGKRLKVVTCLQGPH